MKNLLAGLLALPFIAFGQNYWQQRVEYKMDINFDVSTHNFSGNQELKYFNNSPDTLLKVYYHLYFNAFQPNSMMDVRSRNLPDPDGRVRDRIYYLEDNEIGFHKIESLTQDGKTLNFTIENTVLEVQLAKPILPGESTTFMMEFNSQVPKQIRRSGRDGREGISYSMSQWFPKMAEYDKSGWHAHPYIAREFFAPWGDYDVNITIDKDYVIGAGAVLQNPDEIGYGYTSEKVKRKGKTLTWKFKAENVHDFMWAADPDYTHTTAQVPEGPLLHFFYQTDTLAENWEELPDMTVKAFQYLNANFGKYPYDHFYVIQGGDGGMEYPMSTLITGHRSIKSLVGVTVHEALHSWYQGVLATNESYFAWMDEGFTSYASSRTMAHLYPNGNPRTQEGNYNGYFALASSGYEEPMSTHSDQYETNFAYGRAAYSKGAVSIAQLGYIIGEDALSRGLKRYFNEWKFKHPDKNDFVRVMEKESGLELDWYYDAWVNSTKTIDYGVDSLYSSNGKAMLALRRASQIPMPIDLTVTLNDGSAKYYYIPLGMMRGEKPAENSDDRVIASDWYWTHPTYQLELNIDMDQIQSIEIDPSMRMADVNRSNNLLTQ